MNSIIDNINKKGQAIRDAEKNADMQKRAVAANNVARIKELAPRIKELWEVCQALLDNKFTIGERREYIGFPYHEFESEGTFHRLGFCLKRTNPYNMFGTIIGFGIVGGGCDGKSALVDKNGEVGNYSYNEKRFVTKTIDDICFLSGGRRGYLYQDAEFTSKLQRIVDGFDEFEAKVLAYANSI